LAKQAQLLAESTAKSEQELGVVNAFTGFMSAILPW